MKFIKRSKFPVGDTFSTLNFSAGDLSKDLPTGAWSVKSAFDDTNNIPLGWLPYRDVQQLWFGDDQPGETTHFSIEGNKLYAFPPPRAAMAVKILAEGVISDLVDDGANNSVLPAHYHHALMDGAMELAFRDDQNPDLAATYKADFDEALADAMAEFAKPRGGRNVAVRGDYFEPGVGMRTVRG